MKFRWMPALAAVILSTLSLSPVQAHGELEGYFIGVDSLPVIASGTYAGLANPNYNRLTWLFSHVHEPVTDSHFHSIGAYAYTGPNLGSNTATWFGHGHAPEPGSGLIRLLPESGRYVTGIAEGEFQDLHLSPTDSLASYTAPDPRYYFLRSGGGRWTGSLAGANIGIQLVSLSPGLHIGLQPGDDLFATGDTYTLGEGSALDFDPIFWTDTQIPGVLEAKFRFLNLDNSTNFRDSGTFGYYLTTVPEPSAIALFSIGALSLLSLAARRRHR